MIGVIYALISLFFMFVSGYPLSCILLSKKEKNLKLVLSPLLGLCADALLFYVLGFYLNLPSKISALIILIIVMILNLIVLLPSKQYLNFKRMRLYPLLASFVYLVMLSFPFFKVGINYMSVWNEDFFGYVTVADYLKEHTVNEKISPDFMEDHPVNIRVSAVVQDQFQRGYYRMGPEYYLSFFSVILDTDTRYLFFPILISFAMLMPLSLFLFLRIFRVPERLIMFIVFLLPFFSFHYYGFIVQLFAQAAGIPILLFLYWCLERLFDQRAAVAGYVLSCISLIGLIILYVEALPFLAPYLLFLMFLWIKKQRSFLKDLKVLFFVVFVLALFFNVKVVQIFKYQVSQYGLSHVISPGKGAGVGRPILFPSFLMETAIPSLWGMVSVPLSAWPFYGHSVIFLFVVIILSIVISGSLFYCLRHFPFKNNALWRSIAVILALAVAITFFRKLDYFLFKLIMWFQFYFCSVFVIGMHVFMKRSVHKRTALMFLSFLVFSFLFFNAVNIIHLGKASLGGSTVWVEWRDASKIDHLQALNEAKKIIGREEPLTVILPGFHSARWASYILKNNKLLYLVNNNRHDFYTKYENESVDTGWKTRYLLLSDPGEDIFRNKIPGEAVVWDGSYFLIADSCQVYNYIYPVSTRRGLIRQANPYIKEIIGWYPYEIYPKSPWMFERNGFRWVQNNSAFVIKNIKKESLRIRMDLEIFQKSGGLNTNIVFDGKMIFSENLSGRAKVLSEAFVPLKDGLARINFENTGKPISEHRFIRLINKDLITDERVVNARLSALEIIPESEVERDGFFFSQDRFTIKDIEKNNFFFFGLFPDGWASRTAGFSFDLRNKRALLYKISVPCSHLCKDLSIDFIFDKKTVKTIHIAGPGEYVAEIPIDVEFQKITTLKIIADRAFEIGKKDKREAAYFFKEGEFIR
ncbi:MAG: hypothetical protein JXB26_11360 [Candidatus Aminicenantes bacterium]|nr:hypothetical protein [Candidatus Aminicenantes bacterium]